MDAGGSQKPEHTPPTSVPDLIQSEGTLIHALSALLYHDPLRALFPRSSIRVKSQRENAKNQRERTHKNYKLQSIEPTIILLWNPREHVVIKTKTGQIFISIDKKISDQEQVKGQNYCFRRS